MKIIDLSIPWEVNPLAEPFLPSYEFSDHEKEANNLANLIGIKSNDFPDGCALAVEKISGLLHVGTHIDAPLHFGPTVNGERAKSIDEMPLELFYGYGVVLDLRHMKPLDEISINDLKEALKKIDYVLKPLDIVLIMTGYDKYIHEERYLKEQPGMSGEATLWLLDQGIKVIGIDAYGFDRPFGAMAKAFKEGKTDALWPAHFVGRQREYCHIEKMGNLDKITKPYGFKFIGFPHNIKGGTAGYVRPVAIIED